MSENSPFVLACWLRADANPDVDEPDQSEEHTTRPQLEEMAERLIRGGRYKLIVLWGGNREEEYDEIKRWP